MNDNKQPNDKRKSKSPEGGTNALFLYTALIFVVALIMILLSFFGKSNLSDKQPAVESPQPEGSGIVQNAAILSEENSALMSENIRLQSELDEKEAEITAASEQSAVSDTLFAANAYYKVGNIEKAAQLLASVASSPMTGDQTIFYEELNQLVNGGIN